MVRVIIKGGVWKNTEDEILKAAISKYGKNQWARISSLLVRKTPKQCKARWYEWLDPSIKKTEWSKEEDEKLLHLAKLMPTQWRTIAPIVGRTANQCLERYQKLLDEAEARENQEGGSNLGLTGVGAEAGPSADDVRRLRPGEVDPDPETKPARPDPIDMDEDEKEMLSEARARLANTQGKKAKRKARERALEEARRLAMLQKRRELKAAGIITRTKTKKKGIDYNADIPFEKKPLPGFYDTSEEASRSFRAPVGKTLQSLQNQGARREDDEASKRKREREAAEKSKAAKAGLIAGGGQNEEQIRKLREAEQISKRRKLNLPAAQVGEAELEEIVKLGQAGERARGLVQDGANDASEGLLADYSALDRAKSARTPRTAPEEDTVMREARNLRNMTTAQTPLLGEANTPLHQGTGAEGATPRSGPLQTPNPLLTPAHGGRSGNVGATPRTTTAATATPGNFGRTPLRTPLRDNLGLNAEEAATIQDTPRNEKMARRAAKSQLQMGLRSLPAPKNDFEIVVDGGEDEEVAVDVSALTEEDAAERNARIARRKEEERQKELARRTQVVQRGLPRPVDVESSGIVEMLKSLPPLSPSSSDLEARAQRMIEEEMIRLVQHDSIAHPLPGSKLAGSGATSTSSALGFIEDERLQEARAMMHSELAKSLGFPGANTTIIQRLTQSYLEEEPEQVEWLEKWLEERRRSRFWSGGERGSWVERDGSTREEVVRAAQSWQLEKDRDEMRRLADEAAKGERTLAKLLGGYQARSGALRAKIREAWTALEEASLSFGTFSKLGEVETGAAAARLEKMQNEVDELERSERLQQARYAELEARRSQVAGECETLAAELAMREAEEINERALAAAEEEEEEVEEIGPMPAAEE